MAAPQADRAPREILLEGVGLHGGRPCAVRLAPARGPTSLLVDGRRAPLGELSVCRADRATVVRLGPDGDVGAPAVSGVEHLLSAVVGLGAFAGLLVEIRGGEVPLLDGCALAFAEAVAAARRPDERVEPVRIRAAGTVQVGDATYGFSPGAPEIGARVSFPVARFGVALEGDERWRGDAADYLARIAPARTFGAARELEALRARGLAAHLPEGAVVALDLDDPRWAPRDPREPIRHKLLDLLGDLALLGGPLDGRLFADRPSHAATAEALRRARLDGLLA